ncbi:MAG: hypothetical protein ACLFNW_05490 [Desulfobacterales bacterium]
MNMENRQSISDQPGRSVRIGTRLQGKTVETRDQKNPVTSSRGRIRSSRLMITISGNSS